MTIYEPTQENIEKRTSQVGTTYYVVTANELSTVRSRIYRVADDQQMSVHTAYDRTKRTLRVVTSR